MALGLESWPDSRLALGFALARGSWLGILARFASGSRYLDKFFLRTSRESLSLSFAPGIQTNFFFALRAKV